MLAKYEAIKNGVENNKNARLPQKIKERRGGSAGKKEGTRQSSREIPRAGPRKKGQLLVRATEWAAPAPRREV